MRVQPTRYPHSQLLSIYVGWAPIKRPIPSTISTAPALASNPNFQQQYRSYSTCSRASFERPRLVACSLTDPTKNPLKRLVSVALFYSTFPLHKPLIIFGSLGWNFPQQPSAHLTLQSHLNTVFYYNFNPVSPACFQKQHPHSST